MKFASTRNPSHHVSFREAVFHGLAPDGGLYIPTSEPDLSSIFKGFGADSSFLEIAAAMTEKLFEDDFSRAASRRIAERAFTFSPRLVTLTDRISILELFHGPSSAFKDFGASFLAAVMEEFLQTENHKAVILTATSGDTGSAVARAFYKKAGIDVVILYPSGRVSPLQEKQLTTLGGNIHACEVQGSFDDCQRMVKEAFVDPVLSTRINLTSANSINLGRLIPQSYYYVFGHSRCASSGQAPTFTVPSGNFGNLTAGIYAWRWGMPVTTFIAATNANDIVPVYLRSGIYNPKASIHTLSNAMDVGNPSNFERLTSIFGSDPAGMKSMIRGEIVTDGETMETLTRIERDSGFFVDPHTAVGILASERYVAENPSGTEPVISVGTAHPAKFCEVVEEATGKIPELPPQLAQVLKLSKHSTIVSNTHAALSEFLMDRYGR